MQTNALLGQAGRSPRRHLSTLSTFIYGIFSVFALFLFIQLCGILCFCWSAVHDFREVENIYSVTVLVEAVSGG